MICTRKHTFRKQSKLKYLHNHCLSECFHCHLGKQRGTRGVTRGNGKSDATGKKRVNNKGSREARKEVIKEKRKEGRNKVRRI